MAKRQQDTKAAKPARSRAKKPAKAKAAPAPVELGGQPPAALPPISSQFKPGNRFWEARASSGPAPLYADGAALWADCVRYFEWVEDNPLYEAQLVSFQGVAHQYPVAKMRPMTIKGLCRFLGVAHSTWTGWRKDRPELAFTVEQVDAVIYSHKFEGAAAGLLNANLIARELGLSDKTELTGKDGAAIQTEDLTPRRPDEDHMADMAQRFLGAAMKHAPHVATALAASGGMMNGAAKPNGAARQ